MDNKKRKAVSILKYFLIGSGAIIVLVAAIIIWIVSSLFSGPDFMEITAYHPFRSEEAKERYLNHYDKRAEEWPIKSDTAMVETSYGRTFIRISGSENAAPLVLLPGGGCNSLIWLPIIKTLSENYRTYSIDNIYDFGRSVYIRPMTTTDDLLIWLDELFNVLKLKNDINLMGLSYGGWLAGQYTLHAPSRLRKVVLLAPAATIFPLSSEFITHMLIGVIPHRYFLKSAVYWSFEDAVNRDTISKRFVDAHVDDAYLGLRCFKFKQPPNPAVCKDDELRDIKVPMLIMFGENEKMYNAQRAVQRINDIAPHIKTDIIPNCGHDLIIIQKKIVNKLILEFLNDYDN
jgi:pimeloyl-ACP methyl ester carboxylesterase